MKTFYKELEELLKKDDRFVSQEGKLMRNAVYEASNKMDEKLLELLMSNKSVKEVFFKGIKGTLVFDKQAFNFAINNRELLPDSYTRFKQKIGLINSKEEFLCANDDVVLSFPFKDCVLEFDSTDPDQKREEVYFNEVLAHDQIDHLFDKKVLCNAVRVDKNGEKKITEFSMDDNLLIKGNNLLAMYSLLPVYKGQIKFMYWDILYNTASDKVPYADSFKHSSWLTMMKNRFEIAKKLLKENGVICVQCDDNEMAYLKVLMDEIFGRDNIINTIVVEMSSTGGLKRSHKEQHFLKTKEYLLVYFNKTFSGLNCIYDRLDELDTHFGIFFDGKVYNSLKNVIEENFGKIDQRDYMLTPNVKKFIIEHKNDIWQTDGHGVSSWVMDKKTKHTRIYYDTKTEIFKAKNDGKVEIYKNANGTTNDKSKMQPLSLKIENIYGQEEIANLRGDIWKDFYKDMGNVNKQGGVKLSGGKKPERLLIDLITAFTDTGDIVLDAYFGTGSSGASAIKIGRKFIGIEQLGTHIELCLARLKNVLLGNLADCEMKYEGNDSFVYCELEQLNANYIDSIKKAKTKKDICEIAKNIFESGFVSCFANSDVVKDMCENVQDAELDDLKKVLIEILDKNQLYVNYSDMNDKEFNVSENDKKFTNSFYEAK